MTVTYRGVQYVPFTHGAASAKALAAAVAGYRFELIGLAITAASAVSVTIEDSAGTNLSEAFALVANGNLQLVLPASGEPWAVTSDSLGLSLLLSDAVTVTGIAIIRQVAN